MSRSTEGNKLCCGCTVQLLLVEATLPATEAAVLNFRNDDEKKNDNARKLNALRIGALALVMETLQITNMII